MDYDSQQSLMTLMAFWIPSVEKASSNEFSNTLSFGTPALSQRNDDLLFFHATFEPWLHLSLKYREEGKEERSGGGGGEKREKEKQKKKKKKENKKKRIVILQSDCDFFISLTRGGATRYLLLWKRIYLDPFVL